MVPNDPPRPYAGRSLPRIVSESTGFLLSWVATDATARFESALGEAGMTAHQLGVLTVLRGGPQMQARLSEQLKVFKPVMVTLINELEAAGWAERRPHPTDRRAIEVHLLPAGRAQLAIADHILRQSSEEMFSSLDESELRSLHEILLRLAGPIQPDDPTTEEST